jgi:DNA repair photolyase
LEPFFGIFHFSNANLPANMIISASRRTDIPACHSEWFWGRLKAGFVRVPNPFNHRQISELSLRPDDVTGMVLWTKNPSPMIHRLDELGDYNYYFQFTLNGYDKDVEPNLPPKSELVEIFKKLSASIPENGNKRVVWRYDPILLNAKYTIEYHVKKFAEIARELKDYTSKCTVSFIDIYRKTKRIARELELTEITERDKNILAGALSFTAHECGLAIDTCAEDIDLAKYGIEHARCVDDRIFKDVFGVDLQYRRDGQREYCGCTACRDIGTFGTCAIGCKYCYAN